MKIAVISDTHSRLENIKSAVDLVRAAKAELILHCGDIEDEEAVQLFKGIPTHFVFGNCDTDRAGLRQAMKSVNAAIHDPFGELELAGRKIAWIHSDNPRLFRDLENAGHFDFLFYGHTHQAKEHMTGSTRVINPGALHRAREKTFLILDLKSGETERVVVG